VSARSTTGLTADYLLGPLPPARFAAALKLEKVEDPAAMELDSPICSVIGNLPIGI
jgi:hypothetical protein